MKLLNKNNLIRLILSYLLSALLFQIIFKKYDILVYLTTNDQTGFYRPWLVLLIFTLIIFIILYKFGKQVTTKLGLISAFVIICALVLDNIIKLGVLQIPLPTISIGYIFSYTPVWRIIIFSFLLCYLIDIQLIKKYINLKNTSLILSIMIGFVLLLYFLIPIMNHLNYREAGLDLGMYDQAIWKYAHFKYPENSINGYWGIKNVLGDHFEIILAIISPIYWLKSSVVILHIFNGLVVATGAYFVYLLSRLKLQNNVNSAKAIVLIYLCFTGLQMAFMEGQFHPLSYVPQLIIIIVYLIEKRKWLAYWIILVLLLSIKENMGLYAVFIGLYILLQDRKNWKVSVWTMGIGLVYYLFAVKAVTALYGKPYRYFNYGSLGKNNLGVIKTLITNPLYVLYVFLNPIGKIETLSLVLGSFGFLVFSLPLVIALPMFGERFLTDDQHIWHFFMHYNAPLAGILICTLIFFLYQSYFAPNKNRIQACISRNINISALILFVVMVTVLININYRSPIFRFFYKFKDNITFDQATKDLNEAVKVVPKDASIAAQNGIVSHFTQRDNIYQLPVVRDAEYIVASSAKDYWLLEEAGFRELLTNAIQNGYGIRYYKNQTLVLQKNYKGELNVIPEEFFQ